MLSSIGRAAIRRAGIGGRQPSSGRVGEWTWQLQRVYIAQTPYDATQAHPTCEPRVLCSFRRSFATTTKAAPKPRATRANTKAKTTTTKKPAAKKKAGKPKAKPKKVAAKRKTPVKKVLTEEQKAKRALVKAKIELKALKIAALLDEPKKLPATAWSVLFVEDVKARKSSGGASFSGVTGVASDAATRYKNLEPSEREVRSPCSFLRNSTNNHSVSITITLPTKTNKPTKPRTRNGFKASLPIKSGSPTTPG